MKKMYMILMIVLLGSATSFAQEYKLAYIGVLNQDNENSILIGTPFVRTHTGDTIGFTVGGGERYVWIAEYNSSTSRRVPALALITNEAIIGISENGISHITIAGKRKRISQKKSDAIKYSAKREFGINSDNDTQTAIAIN